MNLSLCLSSSLLAPSGTKFNFPNFLNSLFKKKKIGFELVFDVYFVFLFVELF